MAQQLGIRPSEWRTVARSVHSVRHAAKKGSERTLCSGPRVSELEPGLTRKVVSVERLLCHVDCLTCMRQLLRIMAGQS